ncbi:MAG TPA: 2OG-Fe(II) oxygenase family protein [Candidatus Nanoarchaeia archaeon]|nr:2OG-Fe(II) oxygenase family protein [Candidatus Nanoarchaeia archaeon]
MDKFVFFSKPFPHWKFDNFLPEKKAVQLLTALSKEIFDLKDSDLFTFFQTNDLKTTENNVIQEFVTFFSTVFAKKLESVTGTGIKLGSVDISGTKYCNTHHLLPHDDQLEGRKLAFIYYLSTLNNTEGGALALYNSKNNNPTEVSERIQPQFNRLVIFKVTSKSFHEVEEVLTGKLRIALSGWFHGK